jgi:SanA protein
MKTLQKIRIRKRFFRPFLIALILLIALIFWTNYKVNRSSRDFIYDDIEKIPYNKVGLLLGTSKYLRSGQPNQYFYNRIQASLDLFNAHKVDYILVSGDNSKKYYNEPLDMKNELIGLGIPDSLIILDYAGFRTYDSVIRLDKIFGQKSFTIISQKFHNQRAVYISRQLDLNAIGYNAKDVDLYNGFKTKLREKLARVKVFIDFLIKKKPKFLGESIEIK